MKQENEKSVLDNFRQSQQTFEEAKKKIADESSGRSKHFRMQKDGTYCVRVLPLAPVIDKDGTVMPMERKGYEYPVKDMVLKICGTDDKGKEKQVYVNVVNTNFVFPDLKCDLIDTYAAMVCEKYADDQALVKKIKESSFNGGLRWNSGRSMYILDADKREEGFQILGLSYSQYKDLEDRKIQIWEKLLKKDPKAVCPISSISDAFLVEITRKTENKKTEYTFNIDTLSEMDVLDEKELNALLDAPKLPEVLYRYTRYHLEATIVFLKQMDEKLQINVMGDGRIAECIDKIKMLLPSGDTSHFTVDGATNSAGGAPQDGGIDALWDAYEDLLDKKLGDKSEEGQDLRADLKKFIDEHELDVTVTRGKTNKELLEEIEAVLSGSGDSRESAGEASAQATEDDTTESENDEPEERATQQYTSSRRSRYDDTHEPAERSKRRSARPDRDHR